jgi:hypothetical protein
VAAKALGVSPHRNASAGWLPNLGSRQARGRTHWVPSDRPAREVKIKDSGGSCRTAAP